MKNIYVWDNGTETNFYQDDEGANDAVREALRDGRDAYKFSK